MVEAVCSIGPDMETFERKIVINFLPINLNMFLGAQKNCLIETVLLSTHNTCFDWEIKKK